VADSVQAGAHHVSEEGMASGVPNAVQAQFVPGVPMSAGLCSGSRKAAGLSRLEANHPQLIGPTDTDMCSPSKHMAAQMQNLNHVTQAGQGVSQAQKDNLGTDQSPQLRAGAQSLLQKQLQQLGSHMASPHLFSLVHALNTIFSETAGANAMRNMPACAPAMLAEQDARLSGNLSSGDSDCNCRGPAHTTCSSAGFC